MQYCANFFVIFFVFSDVLNSLKIIFASVKPTNWNSNKLCIPQSNNVKIFMNYKMINSTASTVGDGAVSGSQDLL